MIESINLNLIPSGVSPVCHVSQYDEGRQIKINLFEGINPYTIQSGDAFTLNVRKPDNTIVTTSVSGTQGNNYITISTTEQIAAVVGENLCELKITNGSTVIGTLNFIMQVERDVLADGIPSQSVIEDLDERIAEAIGDNYYNKTETDSLLALKADKSELYNVYPTEQESGAIAHFTDGADNIPVKSLVSQIVATGGGGTPDAPIAINGFDSGVITRCGKNLFNFSPTTVTSSRTIVSDIFLKAGNYVCSFLINNTTAISGYFQVRIGTTSIGGVNFAANYRGIVSKAFTLSEDSTVNIFVGGASAGYNFEFSNGQIEVGTQSTDYEAYNGNAYEFAFGQTVYGGYFDNKGNLVVTHGIVDLGSVTWQYNSSYSVFYTTNIKGIAYGAPFICEIYEDAGPVSLSLLENYSGELRAESLYIKNTDYGSDANAFKTAMNGIMLVRELANPITLAITSQDIPTLLGENNFYSDTGDVDVIIRADIGLYIDKRLNANRSTPNNLSRAAAYVEDPESVNETQEDNVEPQNEER